MAVGATGGFSEFHGGKTQALAAVLTIMTEVAAVYERELGIRLRLVPNLDELVFADKDDDPFISEEPSDEFIRQAQNLFDQRVGSANYDVGIVLSRGNFGLAHLGSVCNPQLKGASCFGLPEPDGRPFHVRMIMHEMGHQFGATHTFNSSAGHCGDNRQEWSAFEPGSGSTIMAYAGLPCEEESFQPWNDDYFHSESLKQIRDFLNRLPDCGEITTTENHDPEVSAGREYTIPAMTPFALTAIGSDPNNDSLLYSWEERDLGPPRHLLDADDGMSPLFRSYPPGTNATRVFPKLTYILTGEQSSAERLPSTDRKLKFRVVARDGKGGLAWSDTQLSVVKTEGPFKITSHRTPERENRSDLGCSWNDKSSDSG